MGDGSFCVVEPFLLQQPQAAQNGGQLVALDGALRAFAVHDAGLGRLGPVALFSLQSGSAWLAAWRRAFSNNV